MATKSNSKKKETQAELARKALLGLKLDTAALALKYQMSEQERRERRFRQPGVGVGNGSHFLLTKVGKFQIPRIKQKALELLGEGWSPIKVAEQIDISYITLYKWRKADEQFAADWAVAVSMGVDRLEDEAHRRAVEGVNRPVYQGGVLVGHTTEYSDRLMELLLRARAADRGYREQIEMTGNMRHQHGHLHLVAKAALPDLGRLDESELTRLYLEAVTESNPPEGQPKSSGD